MKNSQIGRRFDYALKLQYWCQVFKSNEFINREQRRNYITFTIVHSHLKSLWGQYPQCALLLGDVLRSESLFPLNEDRSVVAAAVGIDE